MNNAAAFLLQLSPAQIQGLTKNQVIQRIGLALVLTPEEHQQCQWQLALLQERRDLLQLRQTHAATQTLANQRLNIIAERDQTIAERDQTIIERDQTIAERDQTIIERDQTIADHENQRRCWPCFFLEKSRAGELVAILVSSILISLLISGLAAAETDTQKQSKTNTLISVGAIGLVTLILLIVWKLARNRFLQHPHN